MSNSIEKPWVVVGRSKTGGVLDVNRWVVVQIEAEREKRVYKKDMQPLNNWRNTCWDKTELVARFATEVEARAFVGRAIEQTERTRHERDQTQKAATEARDAHYAAERRHRDALAAFINAAS